MNLSVVAGGVVVSDGYVLLIHRAKQGDWCLPKGKLDPGETPEVAALREVEEESGYRCSIVRSLGAQRYKGRRNRPKQAHWYLMVENGGGFVPCAEVDAVKWARADHAMALLRPREQSVLIAAILSLSLNTATL